MSKKELTLIYFGMVATSRGAATPLELKQCWSVAGTLAEFALKMANR